MLNIIKKEVFHCFLYPWFIPIIGLSIAKNEKEKHQNKKIHLVFRSPVPLLLAFFQSLWPSMDVEYDGEDD